MSSVAQNSTAVKGAETERTAEERVEVRDQRKAGWFWLDNDLIDRAGRAQVEFTWRGEKKSEKLGPTALAVYMALARHAGYRTQKCWPSQRTIADEIGVSHTDTVQRALLKLEALGIIKGKRRDRCAATWVLLDRKHWRLPPFSSPTEQGSPEVGMEGGSDSYPTEQGSYLTEQGSPTLIDRDELDTSTKHRNKTHHDAAADAADDDAGGDDEGQSPKGNGHADDEFQYDGGQGPEDHDDEPDLLHLLTLLGDDKPEQAVERALAAGWSVEDLAGEVQRLAAMNGSSVRSKPGWLRSMLSKGPEAVAAALDRLGAPRTNGNNEGGRIERLKGEYETLLAAMCSAGTPDEERPQIERRGKAVRAELERRGVDVDSLRDQLLRSWGLLEDPPPKPKASPDGQEMDLRGWLDREGVDSIEDLIDRQRAAA